MDTDLPPGQGINAAADWIVAQFDAISRECGGCLEVKRDTFTADPASGARWARRIPKPTQITNVYAILRGTDPAQAKRMVLVTGHYDSINSNVRKNWADTSGAAPGANDDASGVAVSLECARALSKLKFPGTIVFVAVAGEEQGLVGSEHLAKLAKDEGWDLEAVLNNDIVGGNTTPGDTLQLKDRVRVFSEGVPQAATPEEARRIRDLGKENDSPSRELARAIAETAHAYFSRPGPARPFTAFLVDRPDRYLRGGDHSSFNHEGFAAVRFTEWREDYNHQHQNVVKPAPGSDAPVMGDLIEFVDFNYVAQVARLNAATLATLAFAPGEPQKVTIVNKMTENGSTLTWEPPAGGRRRALRGAVARNNLVQLAVCEAGCGNGGQRRGHGVASHLQGQRDLRRAGGRCERSSRARCRSLSTQWLPGSIAGCEFSPHDTPKPFHLTCSLRCQGLAPLSLRFPTFAAPPACWCW